MVGGNLRQPGPLAAAGLVALKTMVTRLAENHDTARQLAKGLNGIDPSLADPIRSRPNLVRVEVDATGRDAAYWSAEMEKRGVLVAAYGDTALRFVTHRHITAEHVREAVRAFADVWAQVSDSKRNTKQPAGQHDRGGDDGESPPKSPLKSRVSDRLEAVLLPLEPEPRAEAPPTHPVPGRPA